MDLTTKDMRSLVTLWQNCLRIDRDPAKKTRHAQARQLLIEINQEWQRRSSWPANKPFTWPTTEAKPGRHGLTTDDWTKDGLLKSMGYVVGNKGIERQFREAILHGVFGCAVPPMFERSYVAEWGGPKTPARLEKMAETIASLTRNAKRRPDVGLGSAIKDWEHDLEFLYWNYYVDTFHFAWPRSAI